MAQRGPRATNHPGPSSPFGIQHAFAMGGGGLYDGRLHFRVRCHGGDLLPAECGAVGRWHERWRYKHECSSSKAPRLRSYLDRDPFSDLDTVRPLVTGPLPPEIANNRFFPEVPLSVIKPARWRCLWAAPYHLPEAMHVKEGRTVVAAVRHFVRKVRNFGHRVLILNDNLSVVLAVSKGRCADYSLLRLCQQLCALCFACDIRVYVRWLPSELNSADADSRRWEVGGEVTDVDTTFAECQAKVALAAAQWSGHSQDSEAAKLPHLCKRAQAAQAETWMVLHS